MRYASVATSSLVTPRRFDLAIKWRYFCHLCTGDDPDSELVYRWHIDARKEALANVSLGMDRKPNTDRYICDCRRLLLSMAANGFLEEYAIPIDQDGELLGGAHRVACALALGIKAVPVEKHTRYVWAPPWGRRWFTAHGLSGDDMTRLVGDWNEIRAATLAALGLSR